MLVFAGMFHLFRYSRGTPKSNVEVVTLKHRNYSFPFGPGEDKTKLTYRDSSAKPLPESSTVTSSIEKTSATESKPIEKSEIKTAKTESSSSESPKTVS